MSLLVPPIPCDDVCRKQHLLHDLQGQFDGLTVAARIYTCLTCPLQRTVLEIDLTPPTVNRAISERRIIWPMICFVRGSLPAKTIGWDCVPRYHSSVGSLLFKVATVSVTMLYLPKPVRMRKADGSLTRLRMTRLRPSPCLTHCNAFAASLQSVICQTGKDVRKKNGSLCIEPTQEEAAFFAASIDASLADTCRVGPPTRRLAFKYAAFIEAASKLLQSWHPETAMGLGCLRCHSSI